MTHEEIVALICITLEAAGVEPLVGRVALLDVILTSIAWHSESQEEAQIATRELVAAYRDQLENDLAQIELAAGMFRVH